ncbi:cytochrome P450, partial [Tanacetum coccineum]
MLSNSSVIVSDSNEVDNVIQVGNEIGFKMNGKECDVARILDDGDHNVNFFALQETMTGEVDRFIIQSLWSNSLFDFDFKKAMGKSRGIVAVWDISCFTLVSTWEGDGYLALLGNWVNIDIPCLFIIVYAPQEQRLKRKLWLELTELILNHNTLSVILGDFNEVRAEFERMGTIFDPRGARFFNNFIESSGLHDIPMGGKRFTRMNNIGSKLSKLDRILRFDIQCKESETTTELRCKIDQLDSLTELDPLSAAHIAARTDAMRHLTSFEYRKLNDLKQKSRYKWDSEGDENTSFFHGIINGRHNRSRINGISILGDWVTDPTAIKNHVFNFFSTRFKEENTTRPSFSSTHF